MKLSRHSFSPPIPNSSRSSSKESHQSPVDWPKEVSWYSLGLVTTLPFARLVGGFSSSSWSGILRTPSSSSSVRMSSSSESWSFPLPLLGSLLGGGGRGGRVRLVLIERCITGFKRVQWTMRKGQKVPVSTILNQDASTWYLAAPKSSRLHSMIHLPFFWWLVRMHTYLCWMSGQPIEKKAHQSRSCTPSEVSKIVQEEGTWRGKG